MPLTDVTKQCSKCSTAQPECNFSKNAKALSGLKSWCKQCDSAYGRKYYKQNKEKIDNKSTKWQKNNPELRRLYVSNWKARNPEKVKQSKQKWQAENKEKIAGQKNAWRLLNMEKGRLYASNRRARKLNAGVFLLSDKELKKLYSLPCVYCGNKCEQIDHVIPLAKGGRHSIGNLAPSCRSCNQSKGSKFITEWKLSRVE